MGFLSCYGAQVLLIWMFLGLAQRCLQAAFLDVAAKPGWTWLGLIAVVVSILLALGWNCRHAAACG